MFKNLYRPEFETVLRDAPAGSIVIDDDGDVFQFLGTECGFVLRIDALTLKEGPYEVLADAVSYPVMLIEMGSAEPIANDKEPTSVLDYLTKVWEEASEPEDCYIPAGSVVIHRTDTNRPSYHVRTFLTDVNWHYLTPVRIVSSPPKVGFYMQEKGHAYYWDGSVWHHRKGGPRSTWQDYGFSAYIGDVKEDK